MPIITPTPPTTPPALPQRADRSTFSARVDAGFTWFVTLISEVYSLAQNAFNNATESATSASAASTSAGTAATQATNASNSAIAAAATVNAVLWVSGTSYTAYTSNVISPANGKTYRRLITGAGTTDPSLDATNWAGLSGEVAGLKLLATLTPTAAANVDALSVFTSTYDDYVIIGNGLCGTASSSLNIRFAVAGVVDTGSKYATMGVNAASSSLSNTISCTTSVLLNNEGADVELRFYNVNSATTLKRMASNSLSKSGSTPSWSSTAYDSIFNSANYISGFRLYFLSGNFVAQGSVRIYGVLK